MTDSFHLPKISLEGLEKIIIAYSHVPDADFFCDGVDGSQRHRDVPR